MFHCLLYQLVPYIHQPPCKKLCPFRSPLNIWPSYLKHTSSNFRLLHIFKKTATISPIQALHYFLVVPLSLLHFSENNLSQSMQLKSRSLQAISW